MFPCASIPGEASRGERTAVFLDGRFQQPGLSDSLAVEPRAGGGAGSDRLWRAAPAGPPWGGGRRASQCPGGPSSGGIARGAVIRCEDRVGDRLSLRVVE